MDAPARGHVVIEAPGASVGWIEQNLAEAQHAAGPTGESTHRGPAKGARHGNHTFAGLMQRSGTRLLFFRDQDISPEDRVSFGRRFGELDVHPAAATATGHPETLMIADDENWARANGEAWHSDVSCQAEPPMASILHMHVTPPSGGDTMFSSMDTAYEALSQRMQASLDGLTAVHDGEYVYRGLFDGVVDKPEYPEPSIQSFRRTRRRVARVCS